MGAWTGRCQGGAKKAFQIRRPSRFLMKLPRTSEDSGSVARYAVRETVSPRESSEFGIPLVVDLDRALSRTNLLIESIVALLRQQPSCVLVLPLWMLRGRGFLNEQIGRRISLDPSLIPYRSDLVKYLRKEKAAGRSLVLATSADHELAQRIAEHLMIFDYVLTTDGVGNSRDEHRHECLIHRFGDKGFDYAGVGSHRPALWSSARKAVIVNPNPRLVRSIERVTPIQQVFSDCDNRFVDRLKALRPRHWAKNLLVFAPLFASHRLYEPGLLGKASIVFVALCCCASSGYVVNDLLDAAADRNHPTKRLRPIASGRVASHYALVAAAVLLGSGLVVGLFLGRLVCELLLVYWALSLAYSFYIKRIVPLDVVALAGLYTLRIILGAAAVEVRLSCWVFAFSTFLFFSLALAKRYAELIRTRGIERNCGRAPSYVGADASLLLCAGTASAYTAVLTLALQISSDAATWFNGRHELAGLLCPLLLYWVTYVWLMAHRGCFAADDPFVFAFRDRNSCVLILLMVGTAFLAV